MKAHDERDSLAIELGLPPARVRRLTRPLAVFLRIEAAGGVVLMACALAALAWANSPWHAAYHALWAMPVGFEFGPFAIRKDLLLAINDGLMTLFFFVVGLEIKRETVAGELSDPRKAALPVVAALGGMVAPAATYWLLQGGTPGQRGWGIPMATDIAFVVGVLALFGKRVPPGLAIMLLSLAIADDIGAVLVIAVAYTDGLDLAALGVGLAGLAACKGLELLGVRRVGVYVLLGLGVWFAFLKSHVHPTVAGVLLGLLTPARSLLGDREFRRALALANERAKGDGLAGEGRQDLARGMRLVSLEAVSPLERLERALHPWVSFAVMPLFAFANAGVTVAPAAASSPVAWAVAAGLVVGKPAGILAFAWLAVRLGLARLPAGVDWRVMAGAGCLGGIGFTMSLFVAGLALPPELLDAGKLGTLAGSAASGALGCVILARCLPRAGG